MVEYLELLRYYDHSCKYQIDLETSIKGSNSIFHCVNLVYYKCHKINFSHGRSYIDSPDWMKIIKATINLINRNLRKHFQYSLTSALNHGKIKKGPQKEYQN